MANESFGKSFTKTVNVIIFISFIALQFWGLNVLQPLESYARDVLTKEVFIDQSREKIALVLIGDRTIDELGHWPINREVYAKLLNTYFMDSKVVAFDLLFPNQTDEDLQFSDAIKNTDNVVLSYVDEFKNQELVTPTFRILENSKQVGYVNYFEDKDGYTRSYIYSESLSGLKRQSLVAAILTESGYELQTKDDHMTSIVRTSDQEIVYQFNKPGDLKYSVLQTDLETISIYELSDIVNARYSKDEFDDKIILVGGSFTGASDTINTPINPTIGVKFVYDALSTILSGKQPMHVHKGIQVMVLSVVLLLIFFISSRQKPIVITLMIVCINTLYMVIYILLASKYIVFFEVVHLTLITTLYYVIHIVSRVIKSDKSIREINTSLDYILNLDDYLLSQLTYLDFLVMLNKEILLKKNLKFIGLYTGSEFDALGFDFKPKKIVLDKMNIFIPIYHDEEEKVIIIQQTKKHKLLELNDIIALIVSANAFYSNKNVIEKKNKMFFNIFKSLVSAMDAKDPITGNHSERVAEIAVGIGRLLGYSSHRIELLRISGLIHDVGKIGINEKILNKPCFYNDEDLIEMRKHPVMGGKILRIDEVDDEIYKTILQHHERVDGKGYPYGLKGSQISEFSKIVKIADVYDALTSKRQYKEAWGLEKVINILKSGSGTEFDEAILQVFLKELEHTALSASGTSNSMAIHDSKDLFSSIFEVWENCQSIISMNRKAKENIPTVDVEDYTYDKTIKFCHLKFGDHMMTRKWLNLTPRHVIAAVTDDFDYYTLQTNAQFQQSVFVFYKEYCNAIHLESETLEIEEIIADLSVVYGEFQNRVEGFYIWEYRDIYIVVKEVLENKSVSLLFIHKYCL